ncbi:hypothetical protein B7494_g7755 [Chlorociboria aeruginascens]|nr:hypothetical protein B7494_g7755 [Chlorociboria aeruginascens]
MPPHLPRPSTPPISPLFKAQTPACMLTRPHIHPLNTRILSAYTTVQPAILIVCLIAFVLVISWLGWMYLGHIKNFFHEKFSPRDQTKKNVERTERLERWFGKSTVNLLTGVAQGVEEGLQESAERVRLLKDGRGRGNRYFFDPRDFDFETEGGSMTSKSRIAQERLTELENASAPFEDQLVEAAKFIGVDLSSIGRFPDGGNNGDVKGTASHGREAWLLRWLLKKLQSPKDEIPRKTALSWRLVCYLLGVIPIHNAAGILSERKFIGILLRTLEDAKSIAEKSADAEQNLDLISEEKETQGKSSKKSKKRSRSGEVIIHTRHVKQSGVFELLSSISAAVCCIIQSTKALHINSGHGQSSIFSAEYMRSVVRTTAEESAQILGSWLSLANNIPKGQDSPEFQSWLTPFVEIWEAHSPGGEALIQFSLHCSQPLLTLLRTMKEAPVANYDWSAQLEQLVARYIIVPAKAARIDNPELDLLSTLTRVSVLQDINTAPILFNIAIRSLQPIGARKRRLEDDEWLQTVFNTLRKAMLDTKSKGHPEAIRGMLQSAIRYKVDLGLPVLRSITTEYALPNDHTEWALLATIIKLDANVFLIPNNDTDLVKDHFTRITAASISVSWKDISQQVISTTLVPLMTEFAKARDLSGFIRHWFAQLVAFEELRKNTDSFPTDVFSAWEDDALQTELSQLLESSLTVNQMMKIFDWLNEEIPSNPDAVCVILEAMAGSISREEVVDEVGLNIYFMMFDGGWSEKLDSRYKWRSWRILSRNMSWLTPHYIHRLAGMWSEDIAPFDSFLGRDSEVNLLDGGHATRLENIEMFRCACAAWNAAREGSHLEELAKPVMLDLLQRLADASKSFYTFLVDGEGFSVERHGSKSNTGVGWIWWSYVRCILVEFPKTLDLGAEMPDGTFKNLMQNIFWIASSTMPDTVSRDSRSWLYKNPNVFPGLWASAINNDYLLNNPLVIAQIIDVMLCSTTHEENILVKSPALNEFSIKCLLRLPLEAFSRRDRERIMQGLQPNTIEPKSIWPAVLSLKIRMMRRPITYEGIQFQDLVDIAIALGHKKIPNRRVCLILFKELAKLIISHMSSNYDSSTRNRAYASEALAYLQQTITEIKESHAKLSIPSIVLSEILFTVLATKSDQLVALNIVGSTDLATCNQSFKTYLLSQFKKSLRKSTKHETKKGKPSRDESLLIYFTIEALAALGTDKSDLTKLAPDVKAYICSLDGDQELDASEICQRLETFMRIYAHADILDESSSNVENRIATVYGRKSIMVVTQALTEGKKQEEKLKLLESLFEEGFEGDSQLDKILTARNIIEACGDVRAPANEETHDEEQTFDLSTAYAILCTQLWKTTSIRKFSLIGSTLQIMLKTKVRLSVSPFSL